MPFTDFSDVFASLHEKAINNVVLQLQRQRPSLFNYATNMFVQHPELLCRPIKSFVDEDVFYYGNPLIDEQDLLRVPGYTGSHGLEFSLQLNELSIDFHPENVHSLPPELKPLNAQRFSIKAKLCLGLGCPDMRILDKIAPTERPFFPIVDTDVVDQPYHPKDENKPRDEKKDPQLPPTHGLPFQRPLCFCLDLFAVLHLEREGPSSNPVIALKLDNLEIVDVQPKGFEDIVECYVRTMLILGFLPKIKLALRALVFNIADVLTVEPTPVPAGVPNNPAVEEDQVKVFISLTA